MINIKGREQEVWEQHFEELTKTEINVVEVYLPEELNDNKETEEIQKGAVIDALPRFKLGIGNITPGQREM